jgi:transposase
VALARLRGRRKPNPLEAENAELRRRLERAESELLAERPNHGLLVQARHAGVEPERTLYHWLEREQSDGTLTPRPHGGGQAPIMDAAGLEILRSLVEAYNDRTLEEYTLLFEQKTGIRPSTSAMDRALVRGRITRKKSRCEPLSRSEKMSQRSA